MTNKKSRALQAKIDLFKTLKSSIEIFKSITNSLLARPNRFPLIPTRLKVTTYTVFSERGWRVFMINHRSSPEK